MLTAPACMCGHHTSEQVSTEAFDVLLLTVVTTQPRRGQLQQDAISSNPYKKCESSTSEPISCVSCRRSRCMNLRGWYVSTSYTTHISKFKHCTTRAGHTVSTTVTRHLNARVWWVY